MRKISIIRLLRLQYHISLRELAQDAGVCHQYLSALELGKGYGGKQAEAIVQKAFEAVITARCEQLKRLSEEYAANRHRLLEFINVEEDNHGL